MSVECMGRVLSGGAAFQCSGNAGHEGWHCGGDGTNGSIPERKCKYESGMQEEEGSLNFPSVLSWGQLAVSAGQLPEAPQESASTCTA